MAKKQSETVGLDRGSPARRRGIPWWVIALIVVVVAVGGLLTYTFWYKLPDIIPVDSSTPFPTPPGQAVDNGSGILYEANFETDVSADWEGLFDTGTVRTRFESGSLIVTVSSLSDEGSWLAMNFGFEDYVIDVDATKIAGPDDQSAIILFRVQDKNNYYRFDLNFDGYYSLSKAVAGELKELSQFNKTEAITVGSVTNHVQIWAVGDVFRFFVNGTQLPMCVSTDPAVQPIWDTSTTPTGCVGGQVVQEWTDSTFKQGKIGLGAQGLVGVDAEGNLTNADATIGFDNLIIKTPAAAGQP